LISSKDSQLLSCKNWINGIALREKPWDHTTD
jgi:hypothetical protein